MIFTLHLESEQHKTDQKTTFSAEMLSLSFQECLIFSLTCSKRKSGSMYNDFDSCNEFYIIL